MFRCLAHLGVIVAGLSIVACWGCGGKSPQGGSPAKTAEQGAKGEQPSAKDTKAPAAAPEKAAAGETKTPLGTDKPAAGKTEPAGETQDPAPEETGSTSGRGGRAVGKVLKRLMEKPEGAKPTEPSPF